MKKDRFKVRTEKISSFCKFGRNKIWRSASNWSNFILVDLCKHLQIILTTKLVDKNSLKLISTPPKRESISFVCKTWKLVKANPSGPPLPQGITQTKLPVLVVKRELRGSVQQQEFLGGIKQHKNRSNTVSNQYEPGILWFSFSSCRKAEPFTISIGLTQWS